MYNAGHQRRAAHATLDEGDAVRRVRCMPLLARCPELRAERSDTETTFINPALQSDLFGIKPDAYD